MGGEAFGEGEEVCVGVGECVGRRGGHPRARAQEPEDSAFTLLRRDRWDEKADPLSGYLSVPIYNELYGLNGGQP